MDIFKFNNPTHALKMESGEIVNNIKSVMWIERFVGSPGEVTITADVSSGLKHILPIGSFISHMHTPEIMVITDHEIKSKDDDPSEIIITGESFETILDQRAVGGARDFPQIDRVKGWRVRENRTPWFQAVDMIEKHIFASLIEDPDDELPYITPIETIPDTAPIIEVRRVDLGPMYQRLVELGKLDNFAIRNMRPGIWSPLVAGSDDTAIVIYKGVDRSGEVVFSHGTGDIKSADYFWSNRKHKDTVYITSKWVQMRINGTGTGYDRRILYINAPDVDSDRDTEPGPVAEAEIIADLTDIAMMTLAEQKEIALTKAETIENVMGAKYRDDYYLGDLVTVMGEYNASATMRIEEHVEIQDSDGFRAYPTFSAV